MDNGKRCFFSEDQTAAEALQNLSRPAPSQQQPAPSLANRHGPARTNMAPRNEGVERRASDVSMLGLTMEARMARVEVMMEALMRDRGLTITPMGSIEREDSTSDGFRSENAFAMPLLDPINPALTQMDQQQLSTAEPTVWPHQSISSNISSPVPGPPPRLIQLRSRIMPLPLPSKAETERYLCSFFTDIHLRYPCIGETSFRARHTNMMASDYVQADDTYFLALNYMIFACCDAMQDTTGGGSDHRAPGWHWCELVNGLVDKDTLLAAPDLDLTLIQLLLFQVNFMSKRTSWKY